jgi:threonine/homoserine/homoserine lactone efflux protein
MHFLWLGPVIVYSFVTAFTPGPNNMMLLASGTNFGFRRTLPHMLGVTIGFMLLQFAVGLGLGGVFTLLPWLHPVLRVAAFGYLLYLAYKIATSKAPSGTDGDNRARPMTVLGAAAFQLINPKTLIVIAGFFTAYLPAKPAFSQLLLSIFVTTAIAFASTATWAGMGSLVQRYLKRPAAIRAFNITMAVLLVLSMIPVLLEG